MRPMYRIAATAVCGVLLVFGSAYAQSNYGGYKTTAPAKQQTTTPATSTAAQETAQARETTRKLDEIMATVKSMQSDLAQIKNELAVIRARVTQ